MTRIALCTIACAVLLNATPSRLSAQQATTDAHIQELIRAAAERAGVSAQAGSTPGNPSQQTPVSSAQPDTRTVVSLTLEEAVKLALEKNLDIAVQRLNPETFDYSIAGLRAFYKPIATSTISQLSANNPLTVTTQGSSSGTATATGIIQGTSTYNAGVTQNVEWGGGSLLAAFNNNRATTSSLTALYDPAYNTNWSAQYTQPLFRNFKIDNNRQQIVVTKLSQDISEIQLQQTIINTVSNVRNAYWDFVFSVEAIDVARRSVDLADQLVKDNQTRVEVGTMAPIDVVTAQSQAAAQRQILVTADGTLRTNEIALKRLIVSGTSDPNWGARLDPVDRPDFNPEPIDLPAALRRALDSRTDLAEVKKNVQVNDITLKLFKNQALPEVDLTARYGLLGQGGLHYIGATGTGINRTGGTPVPGGYTDALTSLLGNNYPTWTVGLNVTYPIGTSQQGAALARAKVQASQVDAQVVQIELQIATDVTTAAVNVQNGVERVQAAQAASGLAQKQLDAEQSKFDVGMSTNYFVVQAQRDLATAQNNELQAILNYRKALVELDRSQQTTLAGSSITILGGAAPGATAGARTTTTTTTVTTGTTTTATTTGTATTTP
jgi:outer membrane protein